MVECSRSRGAACLSWVVMLSLLRVCLFCVVLHHLHIYNLGFVLKKYIACFGATSGCVRQGGGGPSLHWAIGQESATKCYQIDVTGVAILHVLCHGTGVASHREVRVTIDLDLLCSGLMTPSYITKLD